MANTMDTTQKIPYGLTEQDSAGNPAIVNPADTISVVSDTPGVVEVVPDATPTAGNVASGFLFGRGVGNANISATVTHPDGTTINAAPQTVSVTAPPPTFNAVAATLALGDAQAQ